MENFEVFIKLQIKVTIELFFYFAPNIGSFNSTSIYLSSQQTTDPTSQYTKNISAKTFD